MKGLFFLLLLSYTYMGFSQTISYENGIQKIIQKHCISCHNKLSIGTMALDTYKDVSSYGKMISYVTQNRLMPPWKADATYSSIKNHNTLSTTEIEIIKNWVDSGMTKNKFNKKNIQKIKHNISTIQKPDLVFSMQQYFVQTDDFTDKNQVFVIPTNLQKDVFINAIEFVPGNRKIVKQCSISIDTSITSNTYDNNDLKYGYSSFAGVGFIPQQYIWYQWTADMGVTFYDTAYVKKISAGAKILMHITYEASTSKQKDISFLKLSQAKNIICKKIIQSGILLDKNNLVKPNFEINIDEKRFFYTEKKINNSIEIISIMPQGQYACYSWEIYAIDSLTGNQFNLLKIPKWDAHWKKKYELEKPITLSIGSKIFGIAYYNNSEENSSLIILPAKKITYGEAERDELFLVQYDFVEKK